MRYMRLMPFSHWERTSEGLRLTTPDKRLTLQPLPELEGVLEQLQKDRLPVTPLIQQLAASGAATESTSSAMQTLWRVDRYFQDIGFSADLVRKGAFDPKYALQRACYCMRADLEIEGFGQATDAELAMLKAVVEVYERLSCLRRHNDDLVVSSAGLPPCEWRKFFSYEEWQYGTLPLGRVPNGPWVSVQEVSSGKWYRIPEEMVFFLDVAMKQPVATTNSSGVACHTSYNEALLRSVYELIERDALMVRWFREEPCAQIIPPAELEHRVSRLEDLGFQCLFLNLTLELAPVVLVLLRREADSFPRLILGMASDPSPVKAMEKALEEVELNVTFVGMETARIARPEDIRRTIDHQLWYDQPENHALVLGMIGDELVEATDIAEGPRTVQQMSAQLAGHGFPWFVASLNQAGQRATGIHTVRSLVAGLTPIGFGFTMEPLGVERLRNPIPSMGWGFSCSPRTTRNGYAVQPFA